MKQTPKPKVPILKNLFEALYTQSPAFRDIPDVGRYSLSQVVFSDADEIAKYRAVAVIYDVADEQARRSIDLILFELFGIEIVNLLRNVNHEELLPRPEKATE
jgi:hypothetical protein